MPVFKKIKTALITLLSLVVTGVVAWYIPTYLEKNQARIQIQELEISATRYLYLVDIENNGRAPLDALDLQVFVGNQVYASSFAGNSTTRDPFQRVLQTPFDGVFHFKEENTNTTFSFPFKKNGEWVTQTEVSDALSAFVLGQSQVWYAINAEPFSLRPRQFAQASVLVGEKRSASDFRCMPKPTLCEYETIKVLPKQNFQRVLASLSHQQQQGSNKIYIRGSGISAHTIKAQATAQAREQALKNLYANLTEKLYGLSVESLKMTRTQVHDDVEASKQEIEIKRQVKIRSEGQIDSSAVTLYFENTKPLPSGETYYELRAYYTLPWSFTATNANQTLSAIPIVPVKPMELSGVAPAWVTNDLADNENFVFAVGDSGHLSQSHLAAKEVAASMALTALGEHLATAVERVVDKYLVDVKATSEKSKQELKTRFLTNLAQDSHISEQIVAYYQSQQGTVYALAVLPISLIEYGLRESLISRSTDILEEILIARGDAAALARKKTLERQLWQRFASSKTKQGMDAAAEALAK